MTAPVEFFGIRHHGPGSARRLVEALDALDPAEVLVEGPADLSDLLPMLASPAMVPPVALLAFPPDDPGATIFWPFARFSPEYQAVLWAVAHDRPVRFIDLPVAWRLPPPPDKAEAPTDDDTANDQPGDAPDDDARAPDPLERDPIGVLAEAAGYEDGESWWRDVIEENPAPGPVFAAVADAMAALRDHTPAPQGLEAAREAHMRLEIAAAARKAEGPVAVVCGAWHVPALSARHAAKDDRALIKGAPRRKVSATWAPWTAPRLTVASGYGAGVTAPGWCGHLWDHPGATLTTRWVARIAQELRADGHLVSTAALIETERLATALAALRDRPAPGFEELREAAVATLCHGQPARWHTIATRLLVGAEVGEIPDDVPLAPLLEDLKRQQKATRLKPEALERELSLDLRSDSGLARSTLLHRLTALDVPWGRLTDSGRSRGTFRERWVLRWDPEFAVALVENLVHGPTIERAAAGRTAARMAEAATLGDLADLVLSALTAQLPDAAGRGTELLATRAAHTDDCTEMLTALPPLADILRYGTARAVDTSRLSALLDRIAVQGALALPYAARNLDDDAAEQLGTLMQGCDAALRRADRPEALDAWRTALKTLIGSPATARFVAGRAARLLHDAEEIGAQDAVDLLSLMLSPGTAVADAAAFFAGFLDGAGQKLLYDEALRGCVDAWLCSLPEDTFTEHLPLFRRVFSAMDRTERKRLMDALFGRASAHARLVPAADADALWAAHMAVLAPILKGERTDG